LNKFKLIAFAVMLIFIATGNAIADETIATPNKLIVFKIDHNTYYTQEIGSTEVNTVQMDTEPFIKDSRTFVPVRFLGNALGIDNDNITWDNTARKATLQGKNKLELTIGNKTMQKDTQKITMDVAPLIVDPGRTMLPARYVAEGLGFKVDWDAEKRLVIAWPEDQPKPDMEDVLKKINPQTQIGEQGSKYNQLSADKIAELKALPYLSEPDYEMGDPVVYKALDCPDTYKGLLDKMELKPGQSFYSSRELLYINGLGSHAVRGVLQTINPDGSFTERDVEAKAFYGGSSRQKEWGWHPVYLFDVRTGEGIQ